MTTIKMSALKYHRMELQIKDIEKRVNFLYMQLETYPDINLIHINIIYKILDEHCKYLNFANEATLFLKDKEMFAYIEYNKYIDMINKIQSFEKDQKYLVQLMHDKNEKLLKEWLIDFFTDY